MARRNLRKGNLDEGQQEESWIWGNNRGGGGAPLRDPKGNPIADLKGVIKAPASHGSNGYDSDNNGYYQDDYDRRDRNRAKDYDRDYDNGIKSKKGPNLDMNNIRGNYRDQNDFRDPKRNYNEPSNASPQGSPKKFMSALQDMYSSNTDREKSEKQKKALEYQESLRRQIEENQRKKEKEKRETEDMKRREYEEYMAHKTGNPNYSSPSVPKKKMPFKQDEDDDRGGRGIPGLEDYRGGAKGNRAPIDSDDDNNYGNNQRRNRRSNDSDNYDSDNDPHRKRGGPSIPSLATSKVKNAKLPELEYNSPRRKKDLARGMNDREEPYDRRNKKNDSYEDDDNDPYQDRSRNRRKASPPRDNDFVSVQEYDHLSALCDKLLSQQEALQDEIKQQANIIKDLQKKTVGTGIPLRSKSAAQSSRSGSVPPRDSRPSAEPVRSKSSMKSRPNSMYDLSSKAKNEPPSKPSSGLNKHADQRKQAKVAFGANVINQKALNIPSKGDVSKGLPPRGNSNARANGAAKNFSPNKDLNNSPPSKGVNGFAKLQLNVNKAKGGPLVVSYEDEAPSKPSGNRGSASRFEPDLELRGESRYIPASNGDQIDLLLQNSRKGKFS